MSFLHLTGDADGIFASLPCRVTRVIDGDTYEVEIILAGTAFGLLRCNDTVRLMDVDTWEPRGENRELGKLATEAVRSWVGDGFPYWLVTKGDRELSRGKYGRLIADLFCPNRDEYLSAWVVENGHEKIK